MYISNTQPQSNKNKNQNDIPKSPIFPRKASNKEFLNEVEEKLKAMRQKRLSRLSAFVEEQSKLSEIRSNARDIEDKEIDQAVLSIQNEATNPKSSFRTIVEEIINNDSVDKYDNNKSKIECIENKQTVKNKTSSTIKFINKLSCVGVPDMRSPVDYNITETDSSYSPRSDSIENSQENTEELYKKPVKPIIKYLQRNTINFPDNFSVDLEDKSDEGNFSKTLPLSKTHPSLFHSDNHKDRKSSKIDSEDLIVNDTDRPYLKRNSLSDLPVNNIEESTVNSYDRILKQPMVSFGKSTSNLTKVSSDSFSEVKVEEPNQTDETKLKKDKTSIPLNKFKPFHLPLNTVISSKKPNRAEKIVRKLQTNWITVNEILENDSDVDADEMEDLKNTISDSRDLLLEYERKVKYIENKKQPSSRHKEELDTIKNKLRDTVVAINKFKGLRRDTVFLDIMNRLSGYAAEVENIPVSSKEKSEVLSEIENCVKILKNKSDRHEIMLHELLTEQVDLIGSQHLPIIV